MRYREWKQWVRSKPWCLRWFIYLVLFRTIIDNFYNLKKVSPFLSPLYLVGVLTPIFIFISFNSRNFPRKKNTKVDKLMFTWGIIVFTNLILLLIFDLSVGNIGNLIKYFTPILLFFYLRHFIRCKRDLIGIFQTFLYSAVFTLILMPYNYFFNPAAFRQLTIGRGGGFRFAGGYADVMSYGIIIICVTLITYYFQFLKINSFKYKNFFKIFTFAVFVMSIIGLIAIKHTSSWVVFLTITGLFFIFLLRKSKNVILLLIIFFIMGTYFQGFISSKIDPLIEKEMNVLEGKSDIDISFNGRMWRWKRYFRIWDQMPVYSKVFGVSLSASDNKIVLIDNQYKKGFSSVIPLMVSGGMHNDYIRILFLSGIIGLFFYMLFLKSIFNRIRLFLSEDKFLTFSAILTIMLFSVTTNPTLYPSLLYIILSIFAYVSLPQKIWGINEKNSINIR